MSRIARSHRRHLWMVLWMAASLMLNTPIVCSAAEEADFPPPPMRPDELLREGIERLTQFLSTSEDLSADKVHAFLDRDIAPYFDFAYMARWAAGRLYRRMSDDQKTALTNHLRATFLSALARNLGSYAQPPPIIDVSAPARGRSDNEIAVFAKVKWIEGFTIQLEFRFYWSTDGWKIFDVAANAGAIIPH